MKKKLVSLLLALVMLMTVFCTLAPAHPGRTDKKGGHTVRKGGWGKPIGSYHKHKPPKKSSSKKTVTKKSSKY